MGKVSLLGCSHPKLVCPCPGTAVPVREGSRSVSTLFTLAPVSKLPEAPQQKAGEETCHLPAPTGPGRVQRTPGDQGTRPAAPHPTRSPEQGPRGETPSSTHTLTTPVPFRTPVVTVPEESLALLPHSQRAGRAARQHMAAPQARTGMFPNLGQKQQAGGLLIASRGALVCLSILQQTRFAALIPIWK